MNGKSNEYQAQAVGNGAVHSLSAVNRDTITVRGVKDVISFDEENVLLVTVCGQMALEGSGLHVHVLNTKDGVVEVTGKLNGLLYYDEPSGAEPKGRGRSIGRFFR